MRHLILVCTKLFPASPSPNKILGPLQRAEGFWGSRGHRARPWWPIIGEVDPKGFLCSENVISQNFPNCKSLVYQTYLSTRGRTSPPRGRKVQRSRATSLVNYRCLSHPACCSLREMQLNYESSGQILSAQHAMWMGWNAITQVTEF